MTTSANGGSGSTGQRFSGNKIRFYTGNRLLLAPYYDDHGGTNNKRNNKHHVLFPSLPEETSSRTTTKNTSTNDNTIITGKKKKNQQCNQWATVTTIYEPNDSIIGVSNLKGWCLVIVGDTITPDETFADVSEKSNVYYLSASYQRTIVGNSFLRMMPFKSFARKNLAYLFAVEHGAKVIYDFDDDNILTPLEDGMTIPPPFHFNDLGFNRTMLIKYYAAAAGDADADASTNTRSHPQLAFNPYVYMGASHNYSWPRGFPLDMLKENFEEWDKKAANGDEGVLQLGDISLSSVGVIQSLCNGDPDNDAIFRLTRPGSTNFTFDRTATSFPLVVPSDAYSPYNAQATTHLYKSFWGLYLPITVPGRVTDIWRAYITQRIMKDVNLHVVFTPPVVVHERSEHDYLSDFAAEGALYEKTSKLLEFLEDWSSDAPSLPQRILELWVGLYERDYIELDDVKAAREWLNTLHSIGYIFPALDNNGEHKSSLSLSSSILPQPSVDGQPYRSVPYFNGRADLSDDSWKTKSDWIERPNDAVLKLILMTMNEWPLIKSWVFYHGKLLGFDKLYVIDSSTDSRVISFLRYARDILGANVLFKDVNLNEVERVMTEVASNIGNSADFLLKVDTDEYLATHDGSTQRLTPHGVSNFLSGFVEDENHSLRTFHKHSRVGFVQKSVPSSDVCEHDIYSSPDKFPLGPPQLIAVGSESWYKALLDSRVSPNINIGGHVCGTDDPKDYTNYTSLGIAHYHSRCIEVEVEVAKRVIERHGYIGPADSPADVRAKMAQMCGRSIEDNFCHQRCRFRLASSQKLLLYTQWLDCQDSMKKNYYAGTDAGQRNAEVADFMRDSTLMFHL